MTKYLLKRIAILLVTLWVVVTLSFFLMQVMPGSPFNNPKLTNDMIAVMNKQYGLDKPVWQQYLQYLWNVLHGDLGTSYQSANQPVSMMISQRLAVSAQLGIQALVVGVLAGLFVGAVSARNKNNWIDNILSVLSTLGISVPSFIIGLLLLDYLGFKWGVLPLSEMCIRDSCGGYCSWSCCGLPLCFRHGKYSCLRARIGRLCFA